MFHFDCLHTVISLSIYRCVCVCVYSSDRFHVISFRALRLNTNEEPMCCTLATQLTRAAKILYGAR